MIRCGFMFCGLFLLFPDANAQSSASDTTFISSDAHQLYRQYMGVEAPLYSGPVYNDYRHSISNSLPFLKSANLEQGQVSYDNILYTNMLLNYDVYKDELVVQNPANQKIFKALKQRLNYFDIAGTRFKMVHAFSGNPVPGFYEVVYSGTKTEILARHIKELDENISGYVTVFSFTNSIKFYLKKGDRYFKIDNNRNLLNALGDKQAEVRKFIQDNRLSWKINTYELLRQVAGHYDQL